MDGWSSKDLIKKPGRGKKKSAEHTGLSHEGAEERVRDFTKVD